MQHNQALSLLRPASPNWSPPVLVSSSLLGTGISEVWQTVVAHRRTLEASGELQSRRRDQARAWMWSLVEEGLQRSFRDHPGVAARIPALEGEVEALERTAAAAARELLETFQRH